MRIILLLVFFLLAGCGGNECAEACPKPSDPKPAPNPPPPGPFPPSDPVVTVWEAHHNDVRCQHGARPVVWSFKLASDAQAWADRCEFRHDPGNKSGGENLAIGTSLTPERAMQMWYEEGRDYPYRVSTPPSRYMHFTQIVWAKTTELGCATAVCPEGNYHVCRYNPPGNYVGLFSDNVKPPTIACQGSVPVPFPAPLPAPAYEY